MSKSHIIVQTFVVLCVSYLLFMVRLSVATHTKIILPLIHRNSIRSPFYNPKLSISNPPNQVIMNSTGQFSLPEDDIRGNLVPDSSSFFINVSIGEPPVPQLLVMDTGSSLTWVCTKCAPGLRPVYDPKQSSTYKEIGRRPNRPDCLDYYYNSVCGQELQCSYHVGYGDGSNTTGSLAMEKFTFETSTEGLAELSNIMFGCGLENHYNADKISGILALGPLQPSLVARVGNRFSYCTGNLSDHDYAYNQLILGHGAIFEGSSTPMVIKKQQYYVNLEGISVGEKQLKIDTKELCYHFVFDSGSAYTLLRRNLLDPLQDELVNLMDGLLQPYKIKDELLCYIGNLVRDLKGFPVVSFHFADGADLDLSVEALFIQRNDYVFCMTIDMKEYEFNIIGAYAQQYYNIGFDSIYKKVTFQRIDCELLEG